MVTQDQTVAVRDWRDEATITIEEAAPIIGINRSTAYKAARAGEIPVLRIGHRMVVPVGALRRMLGEIDPMNENGQPAKLPVPTTLGSGIARREGYTEK